MPYIKKVIWKVNLLTTDFQNIEIPDVAEFLSVDCQGETICLWFACNPDSPKVKRGIRVAGTGHLIDEITQSGYIGSVQVHLHRGLFVWHVFDLNREINVEEENTALRAISREVIG